MIGQVQNRKSHFEIDLSIIMTKTYMRSEAQLHHSNGCDANKNHACLISQAHEL